MNWARGEIAHLVMRVHTYMYVSVRIFKKCLCSRAQEIKLPSSNSEKHYTCMYLNLCSLNIFSVRSQIKELCDFHGPSRGPAYAPQDCAASHEASEGLCPQTFPTQACASVDLWAESKEFEVERGEQGKEGEGRGRKGRGGE